MSLSGFFVASRNQQKHCEYINIGGPWLIGISSIKEVFWNVPICLGCVSYYTGIPRPTRFFIVRFHLPSTNFWACKSLWAISIYILYYGKSETTGKHAFVILEIGIHMYVWQEAKCPFKACVAIDAFKSLLSKILLVLVYIVGSQYCSLIW